MSYNQMIQRKSYTLALILFLSIILRAIVNGIYIGMASVVPYFLGAVVLTGLLLLMVRFVHPVAMMFVMVGFLSAFTMVLMVAFPCTTNYLMFFLLMFFVVIYEDIRPIIMQAIICCIAMVYFYSRYAEEMAASWSPDAMAISLVYVGSAMFVFIALCRFSKEQLHNEEESRSQAMDQTEQNEKLLHQIRKSVRTLENTSQNLSESIATTKEISSQIGIAAGNVSDSVLAEAEKTTNIKSQVEEGVTRIREVSDASTSMQDLSQLNADRVHEGGQRVEDLSQKMEELNLQMSDIANAVSSLTDQTSHIVEILGELNSITSQTNLLSLNASIEAARAGEAGRGFAVVADEIRNLSENSKSFSDQIHDIVNTIASQTDALTRELSVGREEVSNCMEHAQTVSGFFQEIDRNTNQVVSKAEDIANRSLEMDTIMSEMLANVSEITENIESTSAAMEEINASISSFGGSVEHVIHGYRDITDITADLVEASNKSRSIRDHAREKRGLTT